MPEALDRPRPSAGQELGAAVRAARWQPPGNALGLVLLIAALTALFSALRPGQFLRPGTAQSMMFQLPELGLLALAMVVPLISGGLNLAIIATANQCALLMAWLMKAVVAAHPGAQGAAIALALVAGLLLCAAIGLVIGFLISRTGVHPILVTLGVMSVVEGVSIYVTRGNVISGFPPTFQWIGNATLLGVPVPFLLFVGVAVAVGLLLTRTAFGVSVYMIGSNTEATRYSGVDTRRVIVRAYGLSGVLCFLAACLMLARFNSASAGYAQSYLLITILAAVLGGVDPNGGFGRIAGLVLALVVLQVIASGCNLLGFSQHLTLAIWGLTLIAVTAVKTTVAALAPRRAARARG